MYYVGLCRERQGDRDEARSLYRTALAVRPDFPEARRKLDQVGDGHERRPKGADVELGSTLADGLDGQSSPTPTTPGDLLYSGHPQLRAFPGRLLAAVVLLAAAATAPQGTELAAERWVSPWVGSVADPALASGLERVAEWLPTAGLVLLAMMGAIGLYQATSLVLTWLGSRYDIYERRIDLREVGFHTNYDSIWLYEITDVRLEIPPALALTSTAKLYIRAATHPAQDLIDAEPRIADAVHIIPGIGGRRFMKKLWQELRDAALVERRAMHRWWV